MSRAYRGPSGAAVASIVVIGLLFSIAFSAVGGWMFMLAVGVAHAHWITTLPTIGYGTALTIAILLTAAFKFASIDLHADTK